MFAMLGKPLDVEYRMDELGRKTGTGGYDKPMRKFWYAARTTKYEKGTVFLTVEVVPDEGHLASSGVALITFPLCSTSAEMTAMPNRRLERASRSSAALDCFRLAGAVAFARLSSLNSLVKGNDDVKRGF